VVFGSSMVGELITGTNFEICRDTGRLKIVSVLTRGVDRLEGGVVV